MARGRTLNLKVQAEVKGAEKLNKLGDKLSKTGEALTRNYTLPLVAAGVAAFKFASDLDEASSKAAQVFTTQGARIEKAAQNLDDAFSEATFKDTIGTFGALLQSMGVTEQAAADLSLAWLDLSQDMASFHNTKPEEALAAIQSALAGEFTPLKRYGVMLNAALIEQRALEAGLWDGVGALDAQTRALVINQELFAQQKKVVGDFERTSDGAANSTRILIANFIDAAALLGQELLPLGTELLKTVNGWIKGFRQLNPETRTWIVRIAGVTAALGPVLFIVGKLVSTFSLFVRAVPLVVGGMRAIGTASHAMLGPLGLVTGAVSLLATGFATDFLGMRTRLEKDIDDFGKLLRDLGDFFFGTADDAEEGLSRVPITADRHFEAYTTVVYDHMQAARGMVNDGVDGMATEMGDAPGKMADELLAAQQELADPIRQLVDFMDAALSPAQEKFRLRGFLASQELAGALASGNPLVRQKAAEMRDAALARLNELDGTASGVRFVLTFANAIERNAWRAVNSTSYMASRVMGMMPRSEPKDPRSPFRGITTAWGFMTTLAEGMARTADVVPATIARSLGTPNFATAGGPRTSGVAGGIVPAGNVTNINLTVEGDLRAKSPEEVVQALQHLSPFIDGKLAPGW